MSIYWATHRQLDDLKVFMGKKRNSVGVDTSALKFERTAKGWSQEELALNIGYQTSTISRIERRGTAYAKTLHEIAKALDVDINKLMIGGQPCSSEEKQRHVIKYFRDMRDILKWSDGNVSAEWFRKSGPIAVDFKAGFVYERKDLLKELSDLVTNNKISILEGTGGHGKSVLLRNHAYNLIKTNSDTLIYHYSFKSDSAIIDFHDFSLTLSALNGLAVIEDVHLASAEIQHIINVFNDKSKCHLLLTTRSSLWGNLPKDQHDALAQLPRMKLGDCSDDIDQIIDLFKERYSSNDFEWTYQLARDVRDISGGDLWLLSYALKGCNGKDHSSSWIENGIKDDLKCIENKGCNPEILVALSYLYIDEVMMSQHFLRHKLGFERKDVFELVQMGEVTKCEVNSEIFYGLPHSSLALAYWMHGNEYEDCLKYPDHEEFVYQYAITGVPGGLKLIVDKGLPKFPSLLDRLANEKKALSVIENESKDNASSLSFFTDLWIKHEKLNDYYDSEEFIEGYMDILLRKKQIAALSSLYMKFPTCGTFLWENIDDTFFWGLFSGKEYSDVFESLGLIVKANKKTKVAISTFLTKTEFSIEFSTPYSLRDIHSFIEPFFAISYDFAEMTMNKIDPEKLIEQINRFDASDILTQGWDMPGSHRFLEMREGQYVFRTLYSIEILLMYIEVYQCKDHEKVEKLLGLVDASYLKELIEMCPVLVRIRFLLLAYKLKSKNTQLFKRMVSDNLEKYIETFMYIQNISNMYLDEIYLNDIICEANLGFGQNLLDCICDKIGLNVYVDKIRTTKSHELHSMFHKFFCAVDPDNIKKWKHLIGH